MIKKERIGVIVSDKGFKTIIVAIQTRYPDSKYMKTLIKTKRYMVHDQENLGKLGDIVLIEESRPFSRNKKWVLKEIIRFYKN